MNLELIKEVLETDLGKQVSQLIEDKDAHLTIAILSSLLGFIFFYFQGAVDLSDEEAKDINEYSTELSEMGELFYSVWKENKKG